MWNWECSRDISECIISHNTWQTYKNIWKRNFIRFFHLPGIRPPSSFIKRKLSSLWTTKKCATEYSDRSPDCRSGLCILQIGADSVELLSHLCNLFIMSVKYYSIHGKGITLCINRFSRYVELRLQSIGSHRIIAIKYGNYRVFLLKYIPRNFLEL